VTAVTDFTADTGPVPSAGRPARKPGRAGHRPERRQHASSWSRYPTATCPEPGSAGPAPAAENVSAASEAAGPGRQHLKLIWSADAVANAKGTWPCHNSTSAGMHGTAIAERADHLPAASPATPLTGRTSQHRQNPRSRPEWSPLTESNRRPSPYHHHHQPAQNRRTGSEQARTLAHASGRQRRPALAGCILPPNCPPE
jgi:hypothetical protein